MPQDDDLHLVSLSSPLVFYESCVTVVVFRVQFNLCLVCFADSFRHRISGFLQGLTIIEYHGKASFFNSLLLSQRCCHFLEILDGLVDRINILVIRHPRFFIFGE